MKGQPFFGRSRYTTYEYILIGIHTSKYTLGRLSRRADTHTLVYEPRGRCSRNCLDMHDAIPPLLGLLLDAHAFGRTALNRVVLCAILGIYLVYISVRF